MARILVVDDEPAMVGLLAMLLGSAGYEVATAHDGGTALRRVREDAPDLVLLDLSLPDISGEQVCHEIRAVASTPVVVVTGRSNGDDEARLLDLGADDYITKPVAKKELLARVRAVLRRASRHDERAPLVVGALVVDPDRRRANVDGTELQLTPIEFRLLVALSRQADTVVASRELLRAGWPGEHDPDPEWLKPHLARLRRKLARGRAPVPRNVRGIGYRLL